MDVRPVVSCFKVPRRGWGLGVGGWGLGVGGWGLSMGSVFTDGHDELCGVERVELDTRHAVEATHEVYQPRVHLRSGLRFRV